MLRVKTYIANSPIHGLGVYAAETIPRGKRIGIWLNMFDRVWFRADYMDLPVLAKQYIFHYGYREGEWYYLNSDNMRYMNHSNTPNIVCENDSDFSDKEIAIGTELTVDYRTFDDDCFIKVPSLRNPESEDQPL